MHQNEMTERNEKSKCNKRGAAHAVGKSTGEHVHVLPVPSPRMKSPPCNDTQKRKPKSRTRHSCASSGRNLNHEVLNYSVERAVFETDGLAACARLSAQTVLKAHSSVLTLFELSGA